MKISENIEKPVKDNEKKDKKVNKSKEKGNNFKLIKKMRN